MDAETRNAVDHVILTRFNLPSPGYERSVRERDGWLEKRVSLFERYCLPTVSAQSTQAFSWIAYFDPASPMWLRERIEAWSAKGPLTPIFRSEVSADQLVSDLADVSGARTRTLVTTNVDNDDAIARDFVERIQGLAEHGSTAAIYLARGLIGAVPFVYRRTDRVNAFCSVSSSWEDAATCWKDWHNELHRHMPVKLGWGEPAWLQVIHGTNVSNRVHGTMVSPSAYAALFPGIFEDGWLQPSGVDRVLDSSVRRPLRWGREAARGAAKRVIVATAGRTALDRVRDRMRGRRGASTPSKDA
ncbi:glycosyltransferase [Sinomonas sp.]|uniref:glycosyltransferase n=1 Tax=Sinomonas sp. TaxID=1914986 RepID=UPI003F7E8322